ncbi:MAG TPA: cache domain-containing protein [Noviherbaspirillum sp.]|uniref:cache domain-containing protein n=1 Tax=Noviherbaspirillum sp. TaxID=1926288 RepID=UPI002F9441AD
MRSMWAAAAIVVMNAALSTGAIAADKGTKEEATALSKKAIAFYKANGKDKAYAEINNKSGQFVDRDLYVYVVDTSGHVRAHGTNPKLIDKDLMQLKDADGKAFVAEVVELVKANKTGWVDYKWTNPVSKQIESKTTYVEPMGDLGFAVGVYK